MDSKNEKMEKDRLKRTKALAKEYKNDFYYLHHNGNNINANYLQRKVTVDALLL